MENREQESIRPNLTSVFSEGSVYDADATFSTSTIIKRGRGASGENQDNVENRVEIENGGEDKDIEDYDDIEEDPIQLTESTHSFLFTEPAFSSPFCFAIIIIAVSYTTLLLATQDSLSERSPGNILGVPVNVSVSVRITQYLALFIGLIMEEEIPNSLYLLRMIPRESLHKRFPRLVFGKFVASLIVRMAMGYFFLINMFIVVAKADEVIGIFYDVLALQFIQQLDDIAFSLAKIDVFGKRLKVAACKKYFHTEFDKVPFAKRKRMTLGMKVLYFLHLLALMTMMAVVSVRQIRGIYHPQSITVTFGDEIWSNALVLNPGGVEERTLVYSWFNGVYERSGAMQDGRPVYVERNKYADAPYIDKVPAEIKYCESEGAWVISHKDIVRKLPPERDEAFKASQSYCAWILRSQETSEFNFLNVPGPWNIWKGAIDQTDLKVKDNACSGEVDCNYNGQCIEGRCECEGSTDGYYGGTHCEQPINCVCIASDYGDTWCMQEGEGGPGTEPMTLYGRPVYSYQNGSNPNITLPDNHTLALIYSGSRYFAMDVPDLPNSDEETRVTRTKEYHAFWDQAYSNYTVAVSDQTSSSSPIGPDFFWIGKRGERYGAYGELIPLGESAGSGYFYCNITINFWTYCLPFWVKGEECVR